MSELKILAIDDNRDNLLTLQAVIAYTVPGSEVLIALDGRQGLELALAEDPDVILLDIVMPGMDGFAVCRKLKENIRLQTIPVLFLTALRTDRESRIKAMEAGAEGFLAKPFDDIELAVQIQTMAKIKKANYLQRLDNKQLSILVDERTRELTERKRIEVALRESEKKYRLLIENMNAGVFQSTLNGIFLHMNSTVAKMAGYENVNELLAKPASCLYVDSADREQLRDLLIKDGEVKNFELRSARKNGSQYWISMNAVIQRDMDGNPETILGIVNDITERKQAEELLHRKEEEYRLLFTGMLDGFALHEIICDDDGHPVDYRFLSINPAFERLTGLKAADLIGHTVLEVMPDTEAYWIDLYGQVALTGKSNHFEQFAQALGRYFEVEAFQPKPGQFAVLFLDVTERKLAEKEKAKLQDKLQQAQKMEAIGVLAGGIAHDFNNILGAILGYTEMAREDAQPGSRSANNLDKVLTSTFRAKDLVRQILAFSRQAVVARIPIKIQPLVKESLKIIRASIPSTITIKQNIDAQCRIVLADPTQIQQIIMNLCTNAFHAMEKTGGILAVTLKTTLIDSATRLDGLQILPGEYVELTISDTGTGIEPEIITKIFDPYFTTKEIGKGTGLGLSITYGIIKSCEGSITVESTVGHGTTFHVYLPVLQKEAESKELTKSSNETLGGKERILFVDDEELLVGMWGDMLERLGYTVLTLSNSSEALTTFMDDPDQFDLVITDQTMPGLTGTELASRMLRIRPELPIILCTGFSYLVNEESAKAIGIKKFALKPLSESSLAKLIRSCLDEIGDSH